MTLKHSFILIFIALGLLFSCSKDDPAPDNSTDQNNDTSNTTDNDSTAEFAGVVDWIYTYGGSNLDAATSVITTPDGGFAVLGYTQSVDGDITTKTATDSDFWVLKLNADGELMWSKTYGGSSDDRGSEIINTNGGGFAVVGFSRSNDGDATQNEGFQDYWVVKLDSVGTLQWEKSYGFAGSDQANAIIQTTDGGYFLSGFLDITASEGQGNDGFASAPGTLPKHGVGEFWGLRLDPNGELIWRRYFGGTNNDRSYGVLQTSDGGFLMTGSSESNDFDISEPRGSYDFWAVRINSSGDLVWEKSFGGSQIDIAYGLTALSANTYLMVGDSRSNDGDVSSPLGNADLWAVAFNDSGNMLWERSYGGSLFDSGRAANTLNNGNIIIAGNSRSQDGQLLTNQGQNDAWMLLTSNSGAMQWQKSLGGSGIDLLNAISPINETSWVAVGETDSSDGDIPLNKGNKDALIVKIK